MSSNTLRRFSLPLRLLALTPMLNSGVAAAEEAPADEADVKARAEGREIGHISLDKQEIFDLSNPEENKLLYRLANRLHIVTKDHIIEQQLLLRPGDAYSARLADESERILRRTDYLYEVTIKPTLVDDDQVDLEVTTRDVWTLQPQLSLSRSGGENKTTIGLEEANLLGRGQAIRVDTTKDVDRRSNTLRFRDSHLGSSWFGSTLYFADNSDGQVTSASLIRPFYALDTRWSAGLTLLAEDRESPLYSLGNRAAEYRQEQQQFSAFGGWSKGLRNGRVRRYTAGVVLDQRRFSAVPDGELPALVPADRELNHPFIGIEWLQDRFTTAENREQIARTEDFYTGTRVTAQLGWAAQGLGSDRDALIYTAGLSHTFGTIEKRALLVSARAHGRLESGDSRNATVSFGARYFRQQSAKRVFYAGLDVTAGHALDLDNVVALGGDTGLRGYPLRYQNGDSRMLLTLEQRYFWDWYPFRLFRVGGAIFADVGRTWGENPVGDPSRGWLRDVGLGLRFAPTRAGIRKVFHLDLAFPLDGDASIDNLQILLESKTSF